MTPDGIKRLMLDEGLRLLPYWDATEGNLTYSSANGWPTIGFGRNLVGRGISFSEAKLMLENDLVAFEMQFANVVTFQMPDVWADVCKMIQYNTGNLAAWPHMLLAMRNGNESAVITEIHDSDAYRGAQHTRYDRFCNAVLCRSWKFSGAENAVYTKMVAEV